jgi:hypothetical protein
VYVPCGSLANYNKSEWWKGYFTNMMEDCGGGISGTASAPPTGGAVNIVVVQNRVTVECGSGIKNYTVRITNTASGKEIIKIESAGSVITLDLNGYEKGTYKVSVIHNGKTIGTRNVVK